MDTPVTGDTVTDNSESCAICGKPVEYVHPRWQHVGFDLTLDESHAANPD